MEIERFTLDNGLRVVLHRDPALPLMAVNLNYHVGSKNEHPGKTGLAHLFEHMLFEGSQHVGDRKHFHYLQQIGGVANGATSRDRTYYYETVPSRYLELALWLESDRMGFLLPALTEEKLETQRQVVMNERLQRVDNQPYGRASERLFELLFSPDHPYRWPVIGFMGDIAGATLGDLQDFFSTYYRPNNAVLTLAGEFEPGPALEAIERYFGPLPAGPALPPLPELTAAPTAGVHEEIEDNVQLPRVFFAHRSPPYGSRQWFAADLLTTALADGKASPLYRELVYRQQKAQGVAAYVYDYELPGALLVVATARAGVSAGELEAALASELDAALDKLTEADVERARDRLSMAVASQFQALDQRADFLSRHTLFFDRPELALTAERSYDGFSVDELVALGRQLLAQERRIEVTVVPKKTSPSWTISAGAAA